MNFVFVAICLVLRETLSYQNEFFVGGAPDFWRSPSFFKMEP